MATLFASTGAVTDDGNSVFLENVEAKLRSAHYDPAAISYTPGDRAPRFKPVMTASAYVLLQVFESEPKTKLFPKAGFYHLRDLRSDNAGFLLEK
jgi:hypothetical protein